MFRRLLILLSLFIFLPVSAGVFTNAMKTDENLVLYLYTSKCSYCVKFNPIYQKLEKIYGSKYKFIKIDASTNEGYTLMRDFNAKYVPFVVVIDKKLKTYAQIAPSCLLDYQCIANELSKHK